MKTRFVAPLALLLLGAAGRETVAADARCDIRYAQVTRFTYIQQVADRPLPALAIKGRYAASAPMFEFFDDDGFLTLMMTLNFWQMMDKTSENAGKPVAVDRKDLLLLRDAATVGRGFFNSIVAYAAMRSDLTSDQHAEVEDAKAIIALWDKIDLQIGNSLAQSSDGPAVLPKGFIASIGVQMERLRPTASRRITSRYRDLAADGMQSQLCEAGAPNPLVGRILCDHDFVTGAVANKAFCRPGSTTNSPAAALNCDARVDDGRLSPTRCWTGAGGPAAPLPPS